MAGSHLSANPIVEEELSARATKLEKHLDADILTLNAPIFFGLDDQIRDVVEERKPKRGSLAIILETPGGYIEVVHRIVDTLRKHYNRVDFYVVNRAMSAGTILALSGDAIFMDYYSVLGPIDPQVERLDQDESWVPALGYLVQYERLLKKSADAAAGLGPELTKAELAVLLNFDQAELYSFEQARNLSVALLKEWLVKYKFKNWTETKTKKTPVDDAMRKARAEEIGVKLNDTEKWHKHGRGISMAVLKEDVNLEIEDFGADPKLNPMLRGYYRLLYDYMEKMGFPKMIGGVIHTRYRLVPLR